MVARGSTAARARRCVQLVTPTRVESAVAAAAPHPTHTPTPHPHTPSPTPSLPPLQSLGMSTEDMARVLLQDPLFADPTTLPMLSEWHAEACCGILSAMLSAGSQPSLQCASPHTCGCIDAQRPQGAAADHRQWAATTFAPLQSRLWPSGGARGWPGRG